MDGAWSVAAAAQGGVKDTILLEKPVTGVRHLQSAGAIQVKLYGKVFPAGQTKLLGGNFHPEV